jgi:predicted dehydrogenase
MRGTDACIEALAHHPVPFCVGFNRRFDPHFKALQQKIAAGTVGTPETLIISSRDPAPPPISYVKSSGAQQMLRPRHFCTLSSKKHCNSK